MPASVGVSVFFLSVKNKKKPLLQQDFAGEVLQGSQSARLHRREKRGNSWILAVVH
jgi:hypothetical protein